MTQYIVRDIIRPQNLSVLPASLLEACGWHSSRFTKIFKNSDYLQIFEYLFKKGALLQPGSPLATWIHIGGGTRLVQDMLDAGAEINSFTCHKIGDSGRSSPLQAAAKRCDEELVLLLLKQGADVNAHARGKRGRTALQASCNFEDLTPDKQVRKRKTIQLLLDYGADVNAPPARVEGWTALQAVAWTGDLEAAILLLRHGADVNAPPCWRLCENALDLAARYGHIDMVKLLLNANALSHHRGRTGYDSAIHNANSMGHSAVAELIRQHTRDNKRCTDLTNPHLAQPKRDWHEYGYITDSDDEDISDTESLPSSLDTESESSYISDSDDEYGLDAEPEPASLDIESESASDTKSESSYISDSTRSGPESNQDSVEYDVDPRATTDALTGPFSQDEFLLEMSGATALQVAQGDEMLGWESDSQDMDYQPEWVQDVIWDVQMDMDHASEWMEDVSWDAQMDIDMG